MSRARAVEPAPLRAAGARFSISAITRTVAELPAPFTLTLTLTPRFASVTPRPTQIGGVARAARPCPVDGRHAAG